MEIHDIHYRWSFQLNDTFDHVDVLKGMRDVFVLVTTENHVEKYQYRCVSNYAEVNAIEAFIITNINMNNKTRTEILSMIQTQFNLSSEEAERKMRSIDDLLENQKVNENSSKIRVRKNPGFGTTFHHERFNNQMQIRMHHIHDPAYIPYAHAHIMVMMMTSMHPYRKPLLQNLSTARAERRTCV